VTAAPIYAEVNGIGLTAIAFRPKQQPARSPGSVLLSRERSTAR
jgi:hypothetical protein